MEKKKPVSYHEALAATEVTVTFTADEARRLAAFFAQEHSCCARGELGTEHLASRMKLRFQRAVDRSQAKARKAVQS